MKKHLLFLLLSIGIACHAQTFSTEHVNDSLYFLVLTTDSTVDKWPLPYPVYRLCTGDVNGDGTEEAIVGVIKPTRFYPEKGRRLFIFKNYHGLVRPLWMGSKLGGTLQDFRFVGGKIRSLESAGNGLYVVAEYIWRYFGLSFERYLAKGVTRQQACVVFNS